MKKSFLIPKQITSSPLPPKELKEWRDKMKMTQTEAADQLGVAAETYFNWERGHRKPRHPVAMRKLMQMALRMKR